mmetsp:Transcript_1826/g.3864  ORF Transcript_1826/g.3864 Transcript_1826/m.3864 type:complete len:96 (-) Transcript_1826:34-321(-)
MTGEKKGHGIGISPSGDSHQGSQDFIVKQGVGSVDVGGAPAQRTHDHPGGKGDGNHLDWKDNFLDLLLVSIKKRNNYIAVHPSSSLLVSKVLCLQ